KGFFYKIARWTVNFDPKKNSPLAPVWIQFLGLMLHLQNNGIVEELAGLVGKYLITDTTTLSLSRPRTVRVCVEMNLMKELPTKVDLALYKSFIMKQSILYERLLRFCTHCVLQGHNKACCTKLHPILVPDKREVIKHGKVTTMGSLGQSHSNVSIPQTIEILEPVETEIELHAGTVNGANSSAHKSNYFTNNEAVTNDNIGTGNWDSNGADGILISSNGALSSGVEGNSY
ncbi:hypothetical protein GIB67_039520, partial [Kingdonia uniflora]